MSITFVIINIVVPIITAKQLVYLTDNLYLELLIASLVVLLIRFISAINHWILRKNTQIFFRGTTKNIQIKAAEEILKIEVSEINALTKRNLFDNISFVEVISSYKLLWLSR